MPVYRNCCQSQAATGVDLALGGSGNFSRGGYSNYCARGVPHPTGSPFGGKVFILFPKFLLGRQFNEDCLWHFASNWRQTLLKHYACPNVHCRFNDLHKVVINEHLCITGSNPRLK